MESKKIKNIIIYILLIIIFVSGCIVCGFFDAMSSEIYKLEREKETLNWEIRLLEGRIELYIDSLKKCADKNHYRKQIMKIDKIINGG
jgi:hypothetical protein